MLRGNNMDNFYKLKKIVDEREKENVERYDLRSKERLLKIIKTKLQTSFIGDISLIEEIFGFLWGHDKTTLTDNEMKWKKYWDILRKRILNNGNDQIRAIDNELKQYSVTWNRYQYKLGVKGNEQD